MRLVHWGQQSRAVSGTLESLVTVGFITRVQTDGTATVSPGVRAPWLAVARERQSADGEGARCQGAGLRLRRLSPSAVQTRVDGDRQAGIQIHGPLQHQRSLAFIAYFHTGSVTRARVPGHCAEVPFGPVKGPLAPEGPWAVWSPLFRAGKTFRDASILRQAQDRCRSAPILSNPPPGRGGRVEGLTDLRAPRTMSRR